MSGESGKGEGGRTLFTRLADAGEEAIQRVGDMPGVGKITEPIMGLRERVDELQRRMRGLDALERRLTDVERRLSRLESDVSGGEPIGPEAGAGTDVRAGAGQVSTEPPSTAGADFPANDPTGGTAGSEESSTSSQAP